MNNVMTDLRLRAPYVNPRGRGVIRSLSPGSRFDWRRAAGVACMLAGMSAFAVALVALRLALFGNLGIDARLPLTAMFAAAGIGTLAFAGAHWLDDQALSPDARN